MEVSTIAEMDERGRLQIALPIRKAIKMEKGGLVRIIISPVEEPNK